ncbi:transporter, putative [Thioalkalivibrio nitratireducens DSM 14787]|uniref:Transporter, putative n=1 Tax=Thioalkalivibrio nitratireducens (strain DSM 14787 / UNIQEM 213 / ALEN2) TaxID=1255043 RepID=L0DWH3_THIND|nr:MMPL family transporter [Thioalkalivibrio nitratireducens]AGA33368.1 transporter, putative [Thioalkalivibrio nitratireducens DSM 14787]
MGKTLAEFSMRHRRWVFAALLLLVGITGAMMPLIHIDTDPENMLEDAHPARLQHAAIKERFNLHDLIVVGVVNDRHPDGIYNPDSLHALHVLTRTAEGIEGVVARDVLSLATVDNVEQVAPGTIRFDWLMAEPPTTRETALALRAAVERLSMVHGTLVSEDGRAAGIYVPIVDKNESHRIAGEIQAAIDTLHTADDFHITGQPVAQDTFGVKMFQQMAISAPLAGLVIFLLMLYFFRSVALVMAPMLLAMATVIATMGLLIGAGFTVHIMSSMIPIFLMPIAVVASVHVLSTFSDRFRAGDDPEAVMADVMGTLFKPVLFTALTTAVAFSSLMLAPIPPSQVFGGFVALGVLLAMVLTLTFVPAYVAALPRPVIERMARRVGRQQGAGEPRGRCLLCEALAAMGHFARRHSGPVLGLFVAMMALAVFGLTQIQINDNPTTWFKEHHPIRIADRVLNEHFAGTYEAYLVLEQRAGADLEPELLQRAGPVIREAAQTRPGLDAAWRLALEEARSDEATVSLDRLLFLLEDQAAAAQAEVWERLIAIAETVQSESLYFQNPQALAYLAALQEHLEASGHVGKTHSLADLVRTVYRELVSGEPEDYRIPESAAGVAQAILSFQSSHRPEDLWHFASPDFRATSIWLQIPQGDNQHMQRVVEAAEAFLAANPLPDGVTLEWGGLTYINLVWQGEMVVGKLHALLSAFAVVLLMMVLLFRSLIYGVLAMLPLTLTIATIYGVMGLVGKDYDMPVAVLSSLSLGLSVDFAIHFLQRLRVALAESDDWSAALDYVFTEPGRAITRNAVVIGAGFLPLLAAPLLTYVTVGVVMASIMIASTVVTLLMLPAILQTWPRLFFGAQAVATRPMASWRLP